MVRALALLILATALLSLTSGPVCADSWALPTTQTYTSCSATARLVVTPRALDDQLDYFEDKLARVEPAGQASRGARVARARLERRVGKRWQVVWDQPIANDVAPVSAIVRDDGAYAVTFDDWHGVGYGPHAVAIYDGRGKRMRAFALSDILPADYIAALPHSVSSIGWHRDACSSRDGRQVIIPVAVPSLGDGFDYSTVDLALDLADGSVSAVDSMAWAAAQATGRKVHAEQVAAAAAEKAAFLAPLLGPIVNTEGGWHHYLREGVARLFGEDASASTTVLRKPGAKDYAVSRTWVSNALLDRFADKVALATLSEPNLVAILKTMAAKLPPASLTKLTIFIAVSDASWPAIVSAMRHTGAKLIQLDPNEKLLQRPERTQQRYGR